MLACSYGRPGNRIMFSLDGTGNEWTDRIQVYEYKGGSFGYTGIVEVEPGTLLFVYDRNDTYPEYGDRRTTAVQGVYVTVRRKQRGHHEAGYHRLGVRSDSDAGDVVLRATDTG